MVPTYDQSAAPWRLNIDEIRNTGSFRAELDLPEGTHVINLEQFEEFSPCQDGGIAAYLFEHGDSGCGDANWPKSLLYVAGWGTGSAMLNGEPIYQDYQLHFMVTQGMRDRDTLSTRYPLEGRLHLPAPSTRRCSSWTSTFGVPSGTRTNNLIEKSSTTSSRWKSPGNRDNRCRIDAAPRKAGASRVTPAGARTYVQRSLSPLVCGSD